MCAGVVGAALAWDARVVRVVVSCLRREKKVVSFPINAIFMFS